MSKKRPADPEDEDDGGYDDGSEFAAFVNCTVKMGLSTFLADSGISARLEERLCDFVERMTSIMYEGSRLANLFVLYHMENSLPLPSLTYNTFMRRPFQAVLREKADELYVPKNTSVCPESLSTFSFDSRSTSSLNCSM
jgi:hypothetical protein